jgi:hypothetical protein
MNINRERMKSVDITVRPVYNYLLSGCIIDSIKDIIDNIITIFFIILFFIIFFIKKRVGGGDTGGKFCDKPNTYSQQRYACSTPSVFV